MKKRLVFTTFLALVAAFALQVPASETSAHGPPPQVRPVYLALGDSLAFGVGASDPATTGYVPLFYDDLRSALPDHFDGEFLMLENLAVGGPAAPPGGETTTSMIAGGQLDAALAELTARNNSPRPVDDVRVVTLDIGGNDMFAVVPVCLGGPTPTCTSAIGTAFATFNGNFDHILDELTAAAGPETTIIVMTYYNPLVNPFCPLSAQAALADALLEGNPAMGLPVGLNDLIRVNAASHGVRVADVFGLLGPSDVQPDCRHANDGGYEIIADEFIAGWGTDSIWPVGGPRGGEGER
jgi:lysophospholipase L1-like esterase